ncbi:YggT family protein [Qipengyuania sp. S6317L1]|uniref:YggT family protein n=1 Tax=Qipengyuania sp. S6317L1 TaxID=2926410 RepID=UPI001FF26489|nr:YggT family protein [Qipengyuania sp. S6317L1]MCK0097809.1 YggT family protein [Qipengyuania sp. S6317L1]
MPTLIDTLIQIISLLVNVFVMLVIVQFVIGLLFAFNVVNQSNQFLAQVYESINRLMEPVLRPVRNIMPQTGALDLSPLVVIVVAQIVLIVLSSIGRSL